MLEANSLVYVDPSRYRTIQLPQTDVTGLRAEALPSRSSTLAVGPLAQSWEFPSSLLRGRHLRRASALLMQSFRGPKVEKRIAIESRSASCAEPLRSCAAVHQHLGSTLNLALAI